MERQRLKIDLESLFPGKTLKIGDQSVVIKPLGLEQLATIGLQLKGIGSILQESGVTWDNYNNPENIAKLAIILLQQFPDVLEEASNIHIDDIKPLPPEYIISIIDKVIEVNLESKEVLEGNFKSLVTKFEQIGAPQKNQK